MSQKVFILKSSEIKTILESEIVCGEKIYYMSDNTSYSSEQISKLSVRVSKLLDKIFKLKNTLLLRNIVLEESDSIINMMSDKNWIKQKKIELDNYFKN